MKTVHRIILVLLMITIASCLTSDSGDDKVETVKTFTVSGNVMDSSGNSISGVTVTLAGNNQTLTVTTGSGGQYVFNDIKDGSYTVTPSKSEYSFTPADRPAVVSGANVIIDTFSGFSGEGSLTLHDGPNVTLTENNAPEVNQIILDTVNSIIDRSYKNMGKPVANLELSARVDGEASGYALVKGTRGFKQSALTQDLTCTLFDFSDDGELFLGGLVHYHSAIEEETHEEIATYSGDVCMSGAFAATESFDIRRENGVEINGTYECISAGNTVEGSLTTDDFEEDATCNIFGRISDSSGDALPDVTVELINTGLISVTDKEGFYYFGSITNGSYRVSPRMEGYTFSPRGREIIVDGSNIIVDNFTGFTGGEGAYSLSGRIVDSSGVAIAGMRIILSRGGDGQFEVTSDTDDSGVFLFENLIDGTYTLRLVHGLYSFSPNSKQITIEGSNVILEPIVGLSQSEGGTYNVYGTIFDSSGGRLADVILMLSGADMTSVASFTDKEGNYFFSGVSDGSYNIIPLLEGYTFAPQTVQVTVSGADVRVENFTGTGSGGAGYTLSGMIVDSSGAAIAGMRIYLTPEGNDQNALTCDTDEHGIFRFVSLASGSYTIRLVHGLYGFTPDSIQVIIEGSDVVLEPMVGYLKEEAPGHNVYGTVLDTSGGRLADVIMILGGADMTIVADKEGNYFFSNVKDGTYQLAPQLSGYTFSPPYRNIIVSGSNLQVESFTGSITGESGHNVLGRILDSSGEGIADVLISINDGTYTGNTDKEGNYLIGGVPDGRHTVTPTLEGYTFSPDDRTVTMHGEDETVDTFTGTPDSGGGDGTYIISGRIVDASGNGIADVTIGTRTTAGTVLVQTDSDGNYLFENLPPGSYVLVPDKEGYTFDPEFLLVTVNDSNVTAGGFTGSGGGSDGAVYNVSGLIVDGNDKGIESVSLTLMGNGVHIPGLTDSDGTYIFENIRDGNYTLIPAKTEFVFNPQNRTFIVNGSDVTVDKFTGSLVGNVKNISGTVKDYNKKPLDGIRMSLLNISDIYNPVEYEHQLTNGEGSYAFENVPDGVYQLRPAHHPGYPETYDNRYVFDPEFVGITISVSDIHTHDFTGWHLISGRVHECPEKGESDSQAKGIPGVTVTCKMFDISWEAVAIENEITLTDNDGNYEFNRLMDGNYKITPKKSGYDFEPQDRNVEIEDENIRGIDFTPEGCSGGGSGGDNGGGDDDENNVKTFTLEINHRMIKQTDILHWDETIIWTGSVIFSVPVDTEGEWGQVTGDGDLTISGNGSFQGDDNGNGSTSYCEWTTSGTIAATVTGNSTVEPYGESQASTRIFNLMLGFPADGMKTGTLVDENGTHDYSKPVKEIPPMSPLIIPVEDGYTVDQELNFAADTILHIHYVLHFGK
ncbi:MAG: carboxypeptidase regulatory-like domain-containing protein [Candidatus Latescibacteria bacterium]|nr:carboxypeptidase regulatory-like domain-containing protein [Candidatus Latescibacterota bacterium]